MSFTLTPRKDVMSTLDRLLATSRFQSRWRVCQLAPQLLAIMAYAGEARKRPGGGRSPERGRSAPGGRELPASVLVAARDVGVRRDERRQRLRRLRTLRRRGRRGTRRRWHRRVGRTQPGGQTPHPQSPNTPPLRQRQSVIRCEASPAHNRRMWNRGHVLARKKNHRSRNQRPMSARHAQG